MFFIKKNNSVVSPSPGAQPSSLSSMIVDDTASNDDWVHVSPDFTCPMFLNIHDASDSCCSSTTSYHVNHLVDHEEHDDELSATIHDKLAHIFNHHHEACAIRTSCLPRPTAAPWEEEARAKQIAENVRNSFLAEAAAQEAMRAERRRRSMTEELDSFFVLEDEATATIHLIDDCVTWLSMWPIKELVAVSTLFITLRLVHSLAHRFACQRLL